MERRKPEITVVVGARPNFTKVAPIIREFEKNNINYDLIHTGQHYDENMSDVFFKELGIPEPCVNLGVGSNSHAKQTAEIMVLFEDYCMKNRPKIVVVVGDVNSTLACAVVVSKIHDIKMAHVEAGLRSFDRKMPEEVNRVVTDIISNYLFCTAQEAADILLAEGVPADKIYIVGDVLIDNLIYNLPFAKDYKMKEEYVLLTLHRPSNTDSKRNLKNILEGINEIAKTIKVIFPIHPRTKKQIDKFGLSKLLKNIDCHKPLGYLNFLGLIKDAMAIITDSGGIQPEAYYLDVPCITLRDTTEHKFTLMEGVNVLVGANKYRLIKEFEKLYNMPRSAIGKSLMYNGYMPPKNKLYDGKAAERIVKILMEELK